MQRMPPLYLFTDFGWAGPYVGQLHAAALGVDPGLHVVDLMHDVPAMRPDLAAYLLPAACATLTSGIVVAVVDPGVGGERAALVVRTPRLTFVGPDNGLLSRIAGVTSVSRVLWRPADLSASFHGRDLFTPVAARLACGDAVATGDVAPDSLVGAGWPDDVWRVVYVDGFGNAMLGVRAAACGADRVLRVAGQVLAHAETFCRTAPGTPFWYQNSQGLVEIAVSGGSAAARLALEVGDEILLD